MKIVVISDTHTDDIDKLPSALITEFNDADAILHAGDIVGYKLIHQIEHINPNVYAVKGNMDPFFDEKLLPKKRILKFDEVRVGLIHGYGASFGLENRLLYEYDDVDIIVYGHAHKPFWGVLGDVHFLNPGSPTNNRYTPFNSYALLFIKGRNFNAKIIQI
ncbi:metallophosphoesterase family protein [Deferribacter abyssi]|uniref:metallophosphoesterase family protein n=1 Tax=Deferribacter abyssi TaxID=213806 RepID=UPI003C1951BB